MLSIARMASGQGRYYLALAREDYYLAGGEPPGRWHGRGATTLGLSSTVKKSHLEHLFSGHGLDGTPLVQNAGKKTHRPGFDLTFSAPKTVSVLWSQADQDTRRAIQEAQAAAVAAALTYLEDVAGFSRRGKAGAELVRAGLIFATFEHGTSRALDPQLHTHALAINVAIGADGRTGTLEAHGLYEHKMVAGALYRSEFAHQLQKVLGVSLSLGETSFEIEGIPEELAETFSKRRAAIEKQLQAYGVESATAAAFATLATREVKELVPPREKLFSTWQETGTSLGFTIDRVQSLLKNRPAPEGPDLKALVHEAADKITRSESHFAEKDLLREVANQVQARGVPAAKVIEAVREELRSSPSIIQLGERDRHTRYTTKTTFELEAKMLEAADRLHGNRSHYVSRDIAEPIITKPRTIETDRGKEKITLSGEQAQAVRELTRQGRGRIRILEGLAGTSKTTTLSVVREAWEKAGYRVLGAALAGKAAKELKKGAGIEHSMTIAMLEKKMTPATFRDTLIHEAKQVGRALLGKNRRSQFKPLSLDEKTVLIIDEAGMVGTAQLARLVAAVEKGGGVVILAGDRRQLQPIEAGGPFPYLADRFGHAELKTITRQRDERDRKNVAAFAQGKAEPALEDLAKRGLLSVKENRTAAIDELVIEWMKTEARKPEGSLIFCGTNIEADTINQKCQRARLAEGLLSTRERLPFKAGELFRGDRVLFTETSRSLGVNNGETGSIVAVNQRTQSVSVLLDDGDRLVIPLRDYKNIRLGYAVTTHKGQGTTVDRAYVLAGGFMQDREISYVQASRARGETRVFTDRNEAGKKLEALARQMSKSRAKELAHQVRGPSIERQR